MSKEKSNLTMGGSMNTPNNMLNIVKGTVVSIFITLILLFAFSVVLTYSDVQEHTIPIVTIVITAISIFIGSSISTIKINKNGIVNGGTIGFIYVVLLYIVSSIVQTGFHLNACSIAMMVAGILAGMIGGIVGVNIKRK